MREKKSYVAIIIFLNIVIATLLIVFFFFTPVPSGEGGGSDPDEPTTAKHEKLRPAVPGKADGIAAETQLMGSGDEHVVFVSAADGVTYIFGNAAVADLDFDFYGGFLCRVDSSGNILGFTYFAGRMTAAAIAEGGFAVATVSGGDSSRLLVIGTDGQTLAEAAIEGAALDIFCGDSNKLAVVTRLSGGSIKLIEYVFADGKPVPSKSTLISTVYALDYFGCYYVGGKYVISARLHGTRYDAVVFYECSVGYDAVSYPYGGSDDNMLTPYAVLPCADGFLALGRRQGEAVVVTVDFAFSKYTRVRMGFDADGAKLIDANGKYYACFSREDGYVTYDIDTQRRTVLTAANGYSANKAFTLGGSPYLICTLDNALVLLNAASGGMRTYSVIGADEFFVAENANGITLVFSAKGGNDVGTPTGGRDIYCLNIAI